MKAAGREDLALFSPRTFSSFSSILLQFFFLLPFFSILLPIISAGAAGPSSIQLLVLCRVNFAADPLNMTEKKKEKERKKKKKEITSSSGSFLPSSSSRSSSIDSSSKDPSLAIHRKRTNQWDKRDEREGERVEKKKRKEKIFFVGFCLFVFYT